MIIGLLAIGLAVVVVFIYVYRWIRLNNAFKKAEKDFDRKWNSFHEIKRY